MRQTTIQYFFYLLVVSLLYIFILHPVVETFQSSIKLSDTIWSIDSYLLLATSPRFLRIATNSFILSLCTSAFSLLLALFFAFLFSRRTFPLKGAFDLVLLSPLILPPFVGAMGIRHIFSRFGPINLILLSLGITSSPINFLGEHSFSGIVLLQGLHLFPIQYLMIRSALTRLDNSLEEVADSLGASSYVKFSSITIPLIKPAITYSTATVFLWSLTDIGTPLIFDVRDLISVEIFNYAYDSSNVLLGSTLVSLTLIITVGITIASQRLNRLSFSTFSGRSSLSTPKPFNSILAQYSTVLLMLITSFAILLPHLSILISSISSVWYMTILPSEISLTPYQSVVATSIVPISLKNSLLYSTLSTALDIVIGGVIAWLLTRGRIRGLIFLEILAALPLAIPGLILAFSYLGTFAGSPIDPREDPTALLIIGYSMRRLPFMLRALQSGLSQIPPTLQEASSNLGATWSRTTYSIVLPLLAPHLLSGAIMCFCFSFLEVSESLILALNEEFYPITKVLYTLLARHDGLQTACALGVVLMIFLFLGNYLSKLASQMIGIRR